MNTEQVEAILSPQQESRVVVVVPFFGTASMSLCGTLNISKDQERITCLVQPMLGGWSLLFTDNDIGDIDSLGTTTVIRLIRNPLEPSAI